MVQERPQRQIQSPGHKQNEVTMKIPFWKKKDSSLKPSERKYFEIWGDSLRQLEWLKIVCLLLIGADILLMILLAKSSRKLPLVIRVDSLGQVQASEHYSINARITDVEIYNFAQTFLQNFLAWNAYTCDEDFERAFHLMTLECQDKLNKYLATNNIPQQIKENKLKVKLNITELTIEKDSPQFLILKVKGNRELNSYLDQSEAKLIIFEDTLTIERVSRSMKTPWGLLVNDWTESIFKQ